MQRQADRAKRTARFDRVQRRFSCSSTVPYPGPLRETFVGSIWLDEKKAISRSKREGGKENKSTGQMTSSINGIGVGPSFERLLSIKKDELKAYVGVLVEGKKQLFSFCKPTKKPAKSPPYLSFFQFTLQISGHFNEHCTWNCWNNSNESSVVFLQNQLTHRPSRWRPKTCHS